MVDADVTTYASDVLGRRTSTTKMSGDVASSAWDQVGRLTGLGGLLRGLVTTGFRDMRGPGGRTSSLPPDVVSDRTVSHSFSHVTPISSSRPLTTKT